MKKHFFFFFFFLALIVIGLCLSGMGAVIPEMAQQFSVSYSVVGRVFLFHGLGYFVSILLAGILGDIINQVSSDVLRRFGGRIELEVVAEAEIVVGRGSA